MWGRFRKRRRPEHVPTFADLTTADAFGAAGALANVLSEGRVSTVAPIEGMDTWPGEKVHVIAPVTLRGKQEREVLLAVTNKRLAFAGMQRWESIQLEDIARLDADYRDARLLVGIKGGEVLQLAGFTTPQVAVWLEWVRRGPAAITELLATVFADPPEYGSPAEAEDGKIDP